MAMVMGTTRLKAASPTKGMSWLSISSEPYADDEMQSGARTPRADGRPSRSSPSFSLTSGGPSRAFFNR